MIKIKNIIIAAIVVFIPFLIALFERIDSVRTIEPKSGEKLEEFRNRQRSLIRDELKVSIGGEIYTMIILNSEPGFLHFPSGPPQLVFDSKGNLVDWVSDSGDSPSFVERWNSSNQNSGNQQR